ncbi:hypothetical protein B0A54_00442 [Friedmanniomyces endolithicus]|uniref:Uncharacterized protein n=1 Tax=Friedmanniomyces endolithicus TaxID=329885 RepID=A0A4U0VKY1_9PEZI|nr:hypothetical protein LTS09_013221 [Friedmanniomyces endolithicus]TKA49773.1 hypothetical protein B0A54_00442 [Friedmanniomyces endolithicus]
MRQQEKNSGIDIQRSKLDCRYCYIDIEQRAILHLDPFQEGRYRHTILAMRREFAVDTKVQCELYATAQRFDPDSELISLKSITPALNSILSRPDDPTQFEYQG